MLTRFKILTPALAGLVASLGFATLASAAAITPGNLVIVRVGDGSAALSSASTAVFLDEYTPAGVLVQSIALPTVVSGTNNAFTNSGTATSEGFLTLSSNGQFLVQAGYGVSPGVTAIATTASSSAPRAIALTALNGTTDTSTILTGDTSYSVGNIRSAASDDGTRFWTAGTAMLAVDGGVRFVATLGATTSTQLSTDVTNTRVVQINNGQLYVSTSSGAFKGVNTVGTGLPTAPLVSTTLLPGMGATTISTYDYFQADSTTLYVADDSGTGGIQKWTESAGTWTLAYTLATATSPFGVRGITGVVNAGVTTLYATSTQTSANNVLTVTDSGVGSVVSVVVSAAANTAFRGLRLVSNGSVSSGTPYCFGDGTGTTACPCGNSSIPGNNEGCLNSLGFGGKLTGAGTPSIANDTMILTGSNMPNSSVLYFQGITMQNGGNGSAFGDGLRCAGGSIVRLGTTANVGNTSTYPFGASPSVSVKGNVTAPGQRTYQAWYRNAASFCTAATFNLTNGWQILWTL